MLRLFNTLSRQEEPFEPAAANTVRMYACGPTVYARAHIGNFRTYVCVDVLRRTLKHLCNYNMHEAINYTDVDDKTIAGAQQAGVPLREYTEQWVQAFYQDAEAFFAGIDKLASAKSFNEAVQIQSDMVRGRGEVLVSRAKASSEYLGKLVADGAKTAQDNLSKVYTRTA